MNVLANRSSVSGASNNDGSTDNAVPLQYKILTLSFNQDCT